MDAEKLKRELLIERLQVAHTAVNAAEYLMRVVPDDRAGAIASCQIASRNLAELLGELRCQEI